MADFQRSELWQSTLRARKNDPHEAERARLRSVYDIFWQRIVALTQRISTDLPGLTLHDEEHLAALWDRASQLTGQGYPINPLEAFVFGGAVLLHDAGHAIAAYQEGAAELKQTPEFRDAVAAILRRTREHPPKEEEIANPPEEVADAALFVALRRLHAKQAEVLAKRDFNGMYLIEDSELRDNLAELIGRIAASHHFDRELLEEKLRKIQGAPGFMPQVWSIQPIKIACLLRCSDAIQIDQKRTPAFAFALHAPRGLSLLHWEAQQLAQPVVKRDTSGGPGALVFTSQRDFTEDKADAWWIAHDLIKNANDELQGCYQLMKDIDLPVFTVDRVSGAESPAQLERHIRASGWRPVSAEVRVSSVEQIVRLFGGQLLYGRDVAVPLRELIQNAADAVRARSVLAKDPVFGGKVVVRLNHDKKSSSWHLVVEDNGIGMSERILVGPLIEFGKSFWTSEEAQDEFPGLVSAGLDQTGRYGIGFFSTLMIAQRIEVTSRRWDAPEEARKLTFRDGLRMRPLLSKAGGASLGEFSTRVALEVTAEDASRLLSVFRIGQSNLTVTLKEIVAHLCPSLDCDVFIVTPAGELILAHSKKWDESTPLEWVREINFAGSRAHDTTEEYFRKISTLIRTIKGPDGESFGRAAIAFGLIEAGIDSIGGLASSRHSRTIDYFSSAYVGSIEFEPSGPRRDAGQLRVPNEVKAWASDQACLLSNFQINDHEKYIAAVNVAEFGGDPSPIAAILINRKLVFLPEVYETLVQGREVFAVLGTGRGNRDVISTVYYWQTPHIGMAISTEELNFLVISMEAWSVKSGHDTIYHKIPTADEPTPSCFLSCLERYAYSQGHRLKIEEAKNVAFAIYKGEESLREKLSKGTELRCDGIKISLV